MIWVYVLSCRCYLQCTAGFQFLSLWATITMCLGGHWGPGGFTHGSCPCHLLSPAKACVRRGSLSTVLCLLCGTLPALGAQRLLERGFLSPPGLVSILGRPVHLGLKGGTFWAFLTCSPRQPDSAYICGEFLPLSWW